MINAHNAQPLPVDPEVVISPEPADNAQAHELNNDDVANDNGSDVAALPAPPAADAEG
jgi:hypothetical protein